MKLIKKPVSQSALSVVSLFALGSLLPLGTFFPFGAAVAQAEDFTIVVLPDTQFYSQDYPDIYTDQTRWIADNAGAGNIRFVTHLGDIVNEAATLSQWENAFNSMSLLDDAEVPYGVVGGNHDFLYPGDYYDPDGANYLAYFNPDRYADKPWFGGASPSGLSNYQIVDVGGERFLFLHLLLETPAAELAWAQEVLNDHQDIPTWVSTHRYLFDWSVLGAGRYDDFNYTFEPLYRHDGIKADDFFNNFIAANKQIYLVHCGHNHAEYRQSSANNYGLTVHEVLADYQSGENGGNGWMRVCRIKPESGEIDVETYSPTLNSWDTDSASLFTLAVDFDAYKSEADESVIHLQNGVNNYAGAEDTWVNEAAGNTRYGGSGTLIVDDDTENDWFGEHPGQALLKFTDMIQGPVSEGDPRPSRIPSNATVLGADLLLTLSDDQDLGNTTYRIYPMTRDWSENDTWNSLGGGIDIGTETGAQIASFQGDNDPDSDYGRELDITATVQAWVDGSLANRGVAILRDSTSGNDDGIDIHSSQAGDSSLRPQLAVEVKYPIANVAPTVMENLSATVAVVNEGDEIALSIAAIDPNDLDPLVFMIEGQDIGFATGSGTVSHYVLMEDEGRFSFGASVRDDEQTVAAGRVEVTVNNLPPVIVSLTGDQTVAIDTPVSFSVAATDPGAYDVLSYAWDMNEDGVYDDLFESAGSTRFAAPGIYVVAVKVSDDDGDFTVGQFRVTVNP